uniref:Histone H2A n=1 Tax=Ganoderma boninense TaxID=34458 RepID=A0A5K1K719_9APHY|nr:Histone H2A [Ganoderma boninense]
MARQTVAPTAWMQLLLVCKLWKKIACDIAELWRVIYVNSNPNWLQLCLNRAARSLIDLHLANVWAGDIQAAKHLILPHKHRIRAIRIHDSHNRLTTSIVDLLTIGLTTLQELSFVPVEWRVKREVSLGLSPQAFPRIQSLTLSGISLPRDPSFYRNIRYLELHEQCCKSNGFTIRHLFDALRAASPSLEDLDLSRFDPIQEERPVEHPQFHLTSLRSFCMDNSFRLASQIVKALLIPPRIHLRLRIVLAEGEAMEHQTTERLFAAIVPSNIRVALDQAEELAVLVERERFRVRVLDKAPSPDPRDRGGLHSERVRIELHGSYFPAEALRAVPVVCAAPLTTLCINSPDIQHDISDWRLAFDAFPLLENLVLHGREVGWLGSIGIPFTALTKEAEMGPGRAVEAGSKSGASCPLLKAVRVEGLSPRALLEGQESRRFFSIVALCLYSRKGHARKLDKLTLRSFLRDEDSKELEGWVGKVEIIS